MPAADTLEAPAPPPAAGREAIIRIRDLAVGFGDRLVIDGLDLDVWRGEILGVVGASGTGKSVLLRTIIGLLQRRRGTIELFGVDIDRATAEESRAVERRWGVLFQQGALFSSLTVKENVQVPLREHAELSPELLEEVAMLKLALVGLPPESASRMPSELSGGMIKRAALARALALDPEIVFLDEPTSGLDPISAQEFDQLILTLRETLGLTVFMVTHDLDSLAHACTRIAALGRGKLLAEGTLEVMKAATDPWLKAYFQGPRARGIFT
jgi:phospholipid/cholesterol/gamma-HCH transport system ATP-binding protein